MENGIKGLADNTIGRVEINDPKEFNRFTIRPSAQAVKRLERLERLTVEAEQRLGNFVVGVTGK